MKFLLLGDENKTLFVEDDKGNKSLRFDVKVKKWVDGGLTLYNNRIGFDPFEPIDSIYRYGNLSCMEDIVEVSKKEAEVFISCKIDMKEITRMLKSI